MAKRKRAVKRKPATKPGSGGRPPRTPTNPERFAVSFRVTADIRRNLWIAAEKNCRSMSQEAEYRLEQTFRDEWLLSEIRKLLPPVSDGR